MATRKILMLHGYSQNATIFSKRMGAIRKVCGKDIEFVFIDAPNILQPADLMGASTASLAAPEVSSHPQDPAEIPRAWWRWSVGRTQAIGAEASFELLKGILSKDRFEGVFGFSQGAAMAALLSAVLERPDSYPPFLIDGKPPHPPLNFCIAISGFKLLDPSWSRILEPSYSTPTLHVVGTNDVVVVPERSQSLMDVSANKKVARHDGGHFVPSKANWRNFFRDYLADPLGDVPLPAFVGSVAGTPTSSVPTTRSGSPTGDKDPISMENTTRIPQTPVPEIPTNRL